MPQMCASCNYHTDDESENVCPNCGESLQYTLLGPRGISLDAEPEPPPAIWEQEPVPEELDEVEQPWGMRFGQIVSAILGAYLFLYIGGPWILGRFLADAPKDARLEQILEGATLLFWVITILATIIASAVAGAGTINWTVQGLGVATGLILPWALLLTLNPKTILTALVFLAVGVSLCLAGAFIGHRLVPPPRVHKRKVDVV